MSEVSLQRTLGDAANNLRRSRCSPASVLALIGSIGPCATTLPGSDAGTNGDGTITIGTAVIAAGLLVGRIR